MEFPNDLRAEHLDGELKGCDGSDEHPSAGDDMVKSGDEIDVSKDETTKGAKLKTESDAGAGEIQHPEEEKKTPQEQGKDWEGIEAALVETVPLVARTMRVGITIYHKLTGTRYELKCTIRHGGKKITIDGAPIEELIKRNYIAPIASLLDYLRSDRLSTYDVDITIGNLEWCQKIDPLVAGYALSHALANILSRL